MALTIAVVALVLLGISGLNTQLTGSVDERTIEDLGWTTGGYAAYIIAMFLLFILLHLVIGLVVFVLRAGEWIALLLAVALISNGAWLVLSFMYPPDSVSTLIATLVSLITYIGLVSGLSLLYLFPDGHFVPRWTWLMVLGWAGIMFFALFQPDSLLSLTRSPVLVQFIVLMIWSGVGLYAQLHRYYQVSSPLQQQQTKWAILGLVLAVFGPFGYFLPFVILPQLGDPAIPNIFYNRIGADLFTYLLVARVILVTGLTLTLMIFPISFVVAIMRYRLWDIDLIINRTLVYGALTSTLAVLYLLGVGVLQNLFRTLTGQGDQLAIVVTTLALAALFNPLRRRIQDVIDRRFYRHRYDAARALSSFSGSVQDEMELEDVSQELLELVDETIQPSFTSIWLRGESTTTQS